MRTFCFALLVCALACGDDDGVADTGGIDGGRVDTGTEDAGTEDTGADDAGDDDAGGDDAGGDDAGGLPTGDCASGDDCEGRECVELVEGGWRVCEDEVTEVTECSGAPGLDECGCPAEGTPVCEGGVACLRSPLAPFCGGIAPQPTNVCGDDLCTSDDDCPGGEQFCLPVPALGRQVRACMGMACATNDDCEAGSFCAPVADPCCGIFGTLACVAPDGCRTSADCEDGDTCHVRDGEGVCLDEPPICPA